MSISPPNRQEQQHNQWDLIMLQNNSNADRRPRLSDLINWPAEDVVEYLNHQPDFVGEAVAKMCYQELSRQTGGAS